MTKSKKSKKQPATTKHAPKLRASQSAAARPILDGIDALLAMLPPGARVAKGKRKSIASSAAVPDAFLEAAGVTVESSRKVAAAAPLDPDAVRETIAFSAAYEQVAAAFDAAAQKVRDRVFARRDAVVRPARQVYRVATALSADVENEELVAHVDEMKAALTEPRAKGKQIARRQARKAAKRKGSAGTAA